MSAQGGSMTESWPTHRRRVIIRKRRHLHGPYDGTAETCWTAGCMACGWRLCSVEWATTYEIARIHIKVAHVLPVEVDQ